MLQSLRSERWQLPSDEMTELLRVSAVIQYIKDLVRNNSNVMHGDSVDITSPDTALV